jgi:mannose-6-phosphate isomerase-like protein (cupin superfamily)
MEQSATSLLHQHPFMEYYLMLSGEGALQVVDAAYHVRPYSCTPVPPNTPHRLHSATMLKHLVLAALPFASPLVQLLNQDAA